MVIGSLSDSVYKKGSPSILIIQEAKEEPWVGGYVGYVYNT